MSSSSVVERPPMPPVAGISDRGIPGSRTASSQYGGPDRDAIRRPSQPTSPPVQRPLREASQSIEERSRRTGDANGNGHVVQESPFMARPPIQTRTVSNSSGGTMSALRSPPTIDPRPARQPSAQLGPPMTFRDNRAPPSPASEKPPEGSLPEKSLRRLATESPVTELAPALRSNHVEVPRTPMSPPPPAKSPARRPSNIRTTSIGSSRVAHDRMNGMPSPTSSRPGSPIPGVPELPTKSSARIAESPKLTERPDVPWRSPAPAKQPSDYFSNTLEQQTPKPLMQIKTSPQSLRSSPTARPILNEISSPVAVAPQTPSVAMPEDIEIDEESAYMDEVIRDFKWSSKTGTTILASRLNDELAALEAANIHAIVENEGRVEDLMAKLDKGIAQCDDMANLLTIYEFELATVAHHIQHIEGQSQGLQVQTANQKALIGEIANVLTSITISEADLDVLKGRNGNLESDEGIDNIERSLVNLFNALKSMRDEKAEGGSMSAVSSKKKEYATESDAFLSRLSKYLQIKFQAALLSSEPDTVPREPERVLAGHENGFLSLFPYASFMLYARQIGPDSHGDYMRKYAAAAKTSWHDAIVNFAGQWRTKARKATSDENDLIFTAAKDQQSIGASRNATLKRSNTLAKQIRSVTSTKSEKDANDSKLPASEVFRIILDNLTLLLSNEQNFITSFFHLSSFETMEFPDFVDAASKKKFTVESLDDHRSTEPDRTLAKEKYILMESIFSSLHGDLANLIDYFAKLDPIQIIGMIKSVEVVTAEWADSDQEFMLKTFNKTKDRLMGLLGRFIDDQVKAIKDLKVTSKKRKGVVPAFEIFPEFVERIEVQLRSTDSGSVNPAQLDIRYTINQAYEQLSKAMFDSVRTLASSASVASQGLVDVEDKEALNYHILMIQNMHQYLEALHSRNNPILQQFQQRAQRDYKEHLGAYTRQIVLRPIGRLVDFTDTVETQKRLKTDSSGKSAISQTSLKRLLGDYEERDIRKGISAMWKRVDKHFSDDDGGHSGLLPVVWKATQTEYTAVVDRFTSVTSAEYPDVKVDWSRQTVVAAFSKREV